MAKSCWARCLRYTFASRLVMSGADIRTVAELLQHRTLSMAMRYSHLAPDFRMAAVLRMQQQFIAQLRSPSDSDPAPNPALPRQRNDRRFSDK